MANAADHLHTGCVKQKPEYDMAALEYGRAAVAFRNAKLLTQAAEAFVKEAEVHEKKNALLYAARAYEQAGLLLRASKKLKEAAQVIERAVSSCLQSKNADFSAMILRRFSQLLESQIPYQVVRLYQGASELFEIEDRVLQALDFTGRASKVLVRSKRYGDAATSLNKEKYLYLEVECFSGCCKRIVAESLAHLCNDDFPAALKCVRESCYIIGFKGSKEHEALVQLLKCYENQDQDRVDEICTSPVFQRLDDLYRNMIKKLKVPKIEDLRNTIFPPPEFMWPLENKDKAAQATKKEEQEEEAEEEGEEVEVEVLPVPIE